MATHVGNKSNLNIGYENYPKTVTSFRQGPSASHVTPFFPMLLAGCSASVKALSYCRESTELFSSFELKTSVFIPNNTPREHNDPLFPFYNTK